MLNIMRLSRPLLIATVAGLSSNNIVRKIRQHPIYRKIKITLKESCISMLEKKLKQLFGHLFQTDQEKKRKKIH